MKKSTRKYSQDFSSKGNPRTKQSFKEECDINNIVAKHAKGILTTHINENDAVYADFSSAEDYHTSVNQVLEAQEAFDKLPSKTRLRFQNDPAKLIEFIADRKNAKEAGELGLLKPDTAPVNKTEPPASEAPPKEPKTKSESNPA